MEDTGTTTLMYANGTLIADVGEVMRSYYEGTVYFKYGAAGGGPWTNILSIKTPECRPDVEIVGVRYTEIDHVYSGKALVVFAEFDGSPETLAVELKVGDRVYVYESIKRRSDDKFAIAIYRLDRGEYMVRAYADGVYTEWQSVTVR